MKNNFSTDVPDIFIEWEKSEEKNFTRSLQDKKKAMEIQRFTLYHARA